MTLRRLALLGALVLGAPFAAQAAPIAAAPMIGAVAGEATLLEDVQYRVRCRPVLIRRYDRFGRPVTVRRERCRRVYVGRGRYRY